MGAFRQGRLGVAAATLRAREDIVRLVGIDGGGAAFHGRFGIDNGREHLVVHFDERRSPSRRELVLCGDCREHVADRPCLFALGDEARPVVIEEAVPTISGNVLGGRNGYHSRHRLGLGCVDPLDVSASMR